MTYIVAFFILTILSAVTLVGIVFLLICYGIAHIRKKDKFKTAHLLEKNGCILCCGSNFEHGAYYYFAVHRLHAPY